MARPLRIDLAGGWYHVTARGIDRRAIIRDDRDREQFGEIGTAAAFAQAVKRFAARLAKDATSRRDLTKIREELLIVTT